MISLTAAAVTMLYIIIGALVFWLLWALVVFIGGKIEGRPGQLFITIGQIALMILAVAVLIGLLISVVSGQPLFRP